MSSASPTARRLRERAAHHRERAQSESDPTRAESHREIARILEEEAENIERGKTGG